MPGVLGVYTAADLQVYGPLKCVVPFNNRDGTPMQKPRRAGAGGRQGSLCGRSGGLRGRRDGAGREGRRGSGGRRHRTAARRHRARKMPRGPARRSFTMTSPEMSSLDYHYGDAEAVKAAFAKAAHVTRLKLVNSRLVVNADGAARGAGVPRRRPLHAPCRLAGRIRHARQYRRSDGGAGEGRAHAHRHRSAARSA